MSKLNLYLFVIAGGSGTRFWPKSTSRRPKQLLSFDQTSSLLNQTVERFTSLVPRKQRLILTTQALQQPVEAEGVEAEILAEPQGRNTAPCIYWAARFVAERDPQAVMLIMPSDHYIPQIENFRKTVQDAIEWAATHDDLVTLGIRPSRPETGYGYLRTGASLGTLAKRVEAFVEKPNLDRATEFFHAGNYLWNGGMFVWRAEVILKAFDQFMPEMKKSWDQAHGQVEQAYPHLTATSIDYGVMEKAKNVVTFPLECGWDDLGSWTSLENLAPVIGAQQGSNVVMAGEVLPVEASGNIIDVPRRLIALLGVNDLIVVEQGESLLIARKDRAQDIKQVVDAVKKRRPELV